MDKGRGNIADLHGVSIEFDAEELMRQYHWKIILKHKTEMQIRVTIASAIVWVALQFASWVGGLGEPEWRIE